MTLLSSTREYSGRVVNLDLDTVRFGFGKAELDTYAEADEFLVGR